MNASTKAAFVVYRAWMWARNQAYDRGWLEVVDCGRPVISVGNVHAGGTGKTPLVVWVARVLTGFGARVVLLSRGYGRLSRQPVWLPAGAPLPEWQAIGDEPWLIRRQLPGVGVSIDGDRVRGARAALAHEPAAVFVMDDGFQHRRLERTLDVVVWPGGRRGKVPLRESPRAVERADVLVVANGERPPAKTAPPVVASVRTAVGGAWPAGRPEDRLSPATISRSLSGPGLVITGVARPERVLASAQSVGLEAADHAAFPDHRCFSPADLRPWVERAGRQGWGWVVTTEKDEPRLAAGWPRGAPPLWVLGVEAHVVKGRQALVTRLAHTVGVEAAECSTGDGGEHAS